MSISERYYQGASRSNRDTGSISDVDEVGPRIGTIRLTPNSPENHESARFTATVTDPGGVASVYLQYEGNAGTVTVNMTLSGDGYTGLITGLVDTSISVKIVATDTTGNIAVRAYYTVTWGGGGTSTPPPIDPTLMLMIAGGVGAVILVLAVVMIVKRR